MRELIVWGLPKGQSDRLHEVILSTQCKTDADCGRIIRAARLDGWHSFRVQVIDGRIPDFAGALRTI